MDCRTAGDDALDRGWGADVEVISPISLREKLIDETKRLAQLYNISQGEEDA